MTTPRPCANCKAQPRLPYHAYCRPCKLAYQRRNEAAAARKARGRARLARWMEETHEKSVQ